ncbi:beta-ketoacyl synthase chain length factor [uncultured Rikenella sp.]|uniref:beta-ketoacyl synthase chain length factor n=1 Tax=uncultured Rikenella sp. TaxID=368003 RepID=UPI0026359E98|nr:beta-ketoacyl synthase chain length factor [uncultured Rikenella sp.]
MCYIENIRTERDLATDLRELIPDASLRRRMSRIVRQSVATAVECVGGSPRLADIDAILTATGWGCLSDSERFLRNICETDEQMLNPTPFIQSTFNTVGAQLALLGGNRSYNTTYVHRSRSFESALLDATLLLADGDAARALVGAFDEQTETQHQIMERMGCWRRERDGEGAVFCLLTSAPTLRSRAKIVRIDFPDTRLTWEECLKRYGTTPDTVVLCRDPEAESYPTVSARLFAEGVAAIVAGAPEAIIYNEYFGAEPTVTVLQCLP